MATMPKARKKGKEPTESYAAAMGFHPNNAFQVLPEPASRQLEIYIDHFLGVIIQYSFITFTTHLYSALTNRYTWAFPRTD